MKPITASIADDMMLSWESQARQYPERGEPGIGYFRGDLSDGDYVDCLLFRGPSGRVWGILNHYPIDSYWEKKHNANLWVHPQKRLRGIGTSLLKEALRRWPAINLSQQRYSEAGLKFIERFEAGLTARAYERAQGLVDLVREDAHQFQRQARGQGRSRVRTGGIGIAGRQAA